MMSKISAPLYRRIMPLAIFAILITLLVASSIATVTDLLSLRGTLSSETEMLEKLKLRASQSKGGGTIDPADYVLSAPSQGVATADLQRRVSELLNKAGADLQLSEIIPPEQEGNVGQLAIAVNFEIEEGRMPDLLFAIENAKPALLVERLSVRVLSAGQAANQRRLQGTATITAAWRGAL